MAGLLALARRVGFEVVNATHLGALVYPAFWLVKKRNRRRERSMSDAEKAVVVQNQIRGTAESRVMGLLMETEMKLGAAVNFPVGIRCIAALRRT